MVAQAGRPAAPDELILDEVALAEGKEYFRLGAISVSNDGRLLAYSVDDNGSERFTARIKDLATGEMLPDEIPGTLSSLVWVAGDTGLVYSLANEQWRTDNARLHWLGQPTRRATSSSTTRTTRASASARRCRPTRSG